MNNNTPVFEVGQRVYCIIPEISKLKPVECFINVPDLGTEEIIVKDKESIWRRSVNKRDIYFNKDYAIMGIGLRLALDAIEKNDKKEFEIINKY